MAVKILKFDLRVWLSIKWFPPLRLLGPVEGPEIDVSEPTIDPVDNIISDDIETSDDIEQSDFVDLESEDLNEDGLDNEKDRLYNVKMIGEKICYLFKYSLQLWLLTIQLRVFLWDFEISTDQALDESQIRSIFLFRVINIPFAGWCFPPEISA